MGQVPLTVVDLFCGAGGMSRGFLDAGFELLFAADKNPAAVETYKANFTHPAEEIELTVDVTLPRASVIIGGPPCQGFSSAGARRSGDSRNTLVGEFARIVAKNRPEAFVFENVEGFLTGEEGARVLDLINPLIEAGYRIHLRKINAANYGVPQHRKRVLVIGGLGWDPTFPEPSSSAFGAPGSALHSTHLPRCPTIMQAFAGLPEATRTEEILQGHTFRPLSASALVRAQMLRPGMTMRDLPTEMQHSSYLRRSTRRVMDGTPSERRGGAPAGVRRLCANEPSKAITSGARTEFLHPREDRNLTLRECARLQTFPDDFVFCGSSSDQALLIGNAVPPVLALQIAQQLRRDLENRKSMNSKGTLLSFVPTRSLGMSPALQRISSLIAAKRYVMQQEEFPFAAQ